MPGDELWAAVSLEDGVLKVMAKMLSHVAATSSGIGTNRSVAPGRAGSTVSGGMS